jgi:midasin
VNFEIYLFFRQSYVFFLSVRTKCAEEDEEVVAAREIDSMFPTYADDDFGDILQNDTLEQLIKVDKSAKLKKINDIVVDADYQLLCGTFIGLMQKYSR